jgi:recombination protein RecA
MMVTPKDLGHFLKRNAYVIRETDVAFIFINQVRDKIGAYIKSLDTPGGHTLKHYLSIRISLTKGEDIKVGDIVIGINSKFTTVKNKLSAPKRSYIIPIVFGKGVDTYRDLVDFAETLGVLTKAGAYYRFEGENIGQGKARTLEVLENNPELLDRIKSMCYNTISKVKLEDAESEEEIE